MIFCVLDTETSGTKENAHILQMSYQLVSSETGEVHKTVNRFISISNNVQIEEGAYNVHHIDHKFLKENGIPICEALDELYADIVDYNIDQIVCHNYEFDVLKMLNAEYRRNNKRDKYNMIASIPHICTMTVSIPICNLQRENSRGFYRKYPKLEELYFHLFEMPVQIEMHNSLNDVIITKECFLHLLKNEKYQFYLDEYRRFGTLTYKQKYNNVNTMLH
jgi:DNA polymerase III epsilon subunit-like protein